MLMPYEVVARDLPDLWFQAVVNLFENGRRFVVDKGSYEGQTRLEYDYFFGRVMHPAHGHGTCEILPDIPSHFNMPNPVDFEYVYGGEGYERSYIEYLMTDTKQPGEDYTYGARLHWQIPIVIDRYKYDGHRNNQLVLQVARPEDIMLEDPPCLRHIDTRIQDNKLHFFIYFRSWDLWGGLPANLAGIETLHKYMAEEIGVEQGEFIVESKGLHLYGYAEELARVRCALDIECKYVGEEK